ncbi:MAG: hypothetical protein HYR62_08415 [Actinobacteria bacterium]|nr:hypothetical protein [Actinomycetota bacterium]MBI3686230.1 hypothetical protein [Actinomycetota bacterium]
MSLQAHEEHHVEVVVTFAAAARPYEHEYPKATTVGQVLSDALAAFGIAADGTTRYYLLHDGSEVDAGTFLDDLRGGHGHGHQVKLALRTETISGSR